MQGLEPSQPLTSITTTRTTTLTNHSYMRSAIITRTKGPMGLGMTS